MPSRSVSFPRICPACLAPGASEPVLATSDTNRFKGFYFQSLTFNSVPYCTVCAARFKRVLKWVHFGAYVVLALGIAVAVWKRSIWDGLFVVVIPCVPLGWIAQSNTSVSISEFDDKSIVFRFRHAEYAVEFRKVNGLS